MRRRTMDNPVLQQISRQQTRIMKQKSLFYKQNMASDPLDSLPQNALLVVLQCVMDHYPTIQQVSTKWYFTFQRILEEALVDKIDNGLINQGIKVFSYVGSFTSCLEQSCLRIDRNLVFQLLDRPNFYDKQVNLSIGYNYYGSPTQQICQFSFVVVRRGTRTVWIQKDESKHFYDNEQLGQIMPCLPICQGDSLKVGVNLLTSQGLIDLSSLSFPKIQVIDLPQFQSLLDKLNHSPFPLLIHPQEKKADWLPHEYSQQPQRVSYESQLAPHLIWKETVCEGVALVTSRMTFRADKVGNVARARALLGVDLEVFPGGVETVHEVKKNNLYFDMENKLELRQGDTLLFYLNKT